MNESRRISFPGAEAKFDKRPESLLSRDANFVDMCRQAMVTPEEVLKFFASNGREGFATQNFIQDLLTEYAKNHPGNADILRSGASGVGKAHQKKN